MEIPMRFAEGHRVASPNPLHSPRLDAVYGHIETNWDGVDLAGRSRPWGELKRLSEELSPAERAFVRDNPAWTRLLDRHFVGAERTRFEALL